MNQGLQLVWNNPHTALSCPLSGRALNALSRVLISCIQHGEWATARQLMARHSLSPLAIAFVATRMSQAGISEDTVLKLV